MDINTNIEKKIHSLPSKEVLDYLNTSKKGISKEEAKKRLKKFGRNEISKKKKFSAIKLFLSQFNSPLVYIILVASFFSALIGHLVDALFIVFVVSINTIVGFLQESKAEKALEKLSKSVKFYCKVIRGGRKKEIESREIVPGDIVELSEGDKVPADGRIISSWGLKANEASLTGEWMAVSKTEDVVSERAGISDQSNMVFMGTIIEEGRALFAVTDTGFNTQIGRISRLVDKEEETKTPIQKKFIQLSRVLGAGILIAIALFAFIHIIRGEDLYTVFITSIALVVSAVPEGLLPVVTVVLALGMRRLSRKKALVRKLNATEGMGAVSVICMDKTGTLTKGEMEVSHILTGAKELLHEKGEIENIKEDPGNVQSHFRALEIAALVNDAYIENPEDEFSKWIIRGRHTDSALLVAGTSAGIDKEKFEEDTELLKYIRFNSKDKYAAKIYDTGNEKAMLYALGAPEVIVKLSENLDVDGKNESISSQKSKDLLNRIDELTKQGLRILACGWKSVSKECADDCKVDNLNLVGFIALKDPLRKNVASSIRTAEKAGIRPLVITGDHKNTARSVIEELGMKVRDSEILEGKDLEMIDDEELKERVRNAKIFARVIPEHKIRIVKALQENGEITAMVGDGINDAPALKAADIGIAVGSGTDIAKEVSDIVLTDDSFAVILKAIEQGRLIKENIRRVVIYLLADDFSELFLFFSVIFLGLPFPLYPIQILWINIVEDSFPNMALTAEKDVTGIMERKPEDSKDPLLNWGYKKFMMSVFFVSGLAALATFYLSIRFLGDLEKARTITFTLIAFDSLLFAYIIRSFRRSVFDRNIFSNKILNGAIITSLIIMLFGLYFPPLQSLLKVVSLGAPEWGIVLGVSFIELFILEYFKSRFLIKK